MINSLAEECNRVSGSPGQEGLVLFDGVELVGGGVTAFAGQLFFGVVRTAGTRNVYITAAEVPTALQSQTRARAWTRAVRAVYNDPWRQQVIVLQRKWSRDWYYRGCHVIENSIFHALLK